jgi:D-3-phosphoglycerate dehydrogenase
VSVHLALTPETRGRVGQSVFDAMRPGAFFINTSRGEVVVENALLAAIRDKGILAGLDVFAEEPEGGDAPFDGPIAREANVYGTHHIGASTVEAEEAVAQEVLRIVAAYQSGQPIPNCVNLAAQSEATHVLVVRHADRVGVLAHVLDVLRRAELNVQEMQNIVFMGGEAACARIALVGAPPEEILAEIASHPLVFAASATATATEDA